MSRNGAGAQAQSVFHQPPAAIGAIAAEGSPDAVHCDPETTGMIDPNTQQRPTQVPASRSYHRPDMYRGAYAEIFRQRADKSGGIAALRPARSWPAHAAVTVITPPPPRVVQSSPS